MVKFYAVKTIALENVDFFQRERICLEKHKQSDSMSRVVQVQEYLISSQMKQCQVVEK